MVHHHKVRPDPPDRRRPYGCPENAASLLKEGEQLCHNQLVAAAVLTEIIGAIFSLDEHALEERAMLSLRKQVAALFADKQSQQWIARDPDGSFLVVPSVEKPVQLPAEADREPVFATLRPE
jgi:hypothetical protein